MVDGVDGAVEFLHVHGEGFFDIGVLAGLDGVDELSAVLMVGRADQDGVDVGRGEQVAVELGLFWLRSAGCGDRSRSFLALLPPDVADGADFDVGLAGKFENPAQQVSAAAADHADADAVVGSDNAIGFEAGRRRKEPWTW